MLTLTLLALATVFLAYTNGANDNFKGVATLFGSGTTDYRRAITWATVTTLAGSLCSVALAAALVRSFSGKGLVPDVLAGTPDFMLAVAIGAGATVMLATLLGFPISTTHSLTGALVGAGFIAVGSAIDMGALWVKFFRPLVVSPVLAVGAGGLLYLLFRAVRLRLGVTEEWCVCAGMREQVVPIPQPDSAMAFARIDVPEVALCDGDTVTRRYSGRVMGVNCQWLLDQAHFLSAGAVSFARGLNDTPKIVALLIAVEALAIQWGMLAVGLGMAVGGLLSARRVAETMSHRVTSMNHGQGFTANLVTSTLVIGASLMGKPVSTTHVSCGALFGMGAVTRQARWGMISKILLSWLLTLPIAAAIAGAVYLITSH